MCTTSDRFRRAIEAIDVLNREDPRREVHDGTDHPKELLYSQRMTRWLERLDPRASEALRLAVRAQHIRRWEIPRERYPEGRRGYHQWRTELLRFHAKTTAEVLREAGYDEETVARVGSLIRKERLKRDPEAQTLEDAACLVFLEDYFADFATKHGEEKIITILRKTWKKMSERAREAALALDLPAGARTLVEKALADA